MKKTLKIEAIRLREQGLSYNEILQHVNVRKSTLSVWLRNIELTPEQIQAQIKETIARLSGSGKSKASKHRKSKRDLISERTQDAAEQI